MCSLANMRNGGEQQTSPLKFSIEHCNAGGSAVRKDRYPRTCMWHGRIHVAPQLATAPQQCKLLNAFDVFRLTLL